MKRIISLILLVTASCVCFADKLDSLEYLLKEKSVTQEKIYIHTDNNCYFVGDTLWYKAYVVMADSLKPTRYSKVLYVELLTPDGYLVERQQLYIRDDGTTTCQFVLNDSLYSGYYEVRAYTKWQLNFNRKIRPHSSQNRFEFYSKQFETNYFREYEGLYSRVLPIYEKPKQPGDYTDKCIIPRPKQRIYADKPEIQVKFYPEGGHIIEGMDCRIAFEVKDNDGQELDSSIGSLDNGLFIKPSHGGRGVFEYNAQKPPKEATFEYMDKKYTFPLPTAQASGVVIRGDKQTKGGREFVVKAKGVTVAAYSVTCRGRLITFGRNPGEKIVLENCPTGINDLTLYDEQARPLASRLFFVNNKDKETQANISMTSGGKAVNNKTELQPYEKIDLTVNGKVPMSIAVYDKSTQDLSYNDGNMLTDMLLTGELHGFVANVSQYFKEGAEEKLDLLMMVQGWRRYKRIDKIYFLPERNLSYEGQVLNVPSNANIIDIDDVNDLSQYGSDRSNYVLVSPMGNRALTYTNWQEMQGRLFTGVMETKTPTAPTLSQDTEEVSDEPQMEGFVDATIDENKNYNPLLTYRQFKNKDVMIEGEIVKGTETADIKAKVDENGNFKINLPWYTDQAVFFITAYENKDSLKRGLHGVKNSKKMDETQYPKYYVKRNMDFPMFCEPYSWYQCNLPEDENYCLDDTEEEDDAALGPENNRLEGDHYLQNVTVRKYRRSKRKLNYEKPAIVIDAYKLYNEMTDYGLSYGVLDMTRFAKQAATYLFGYLDQATDAKIRGLINDNKTTFYRNYVQTSSEHDIPMTKTAMLDLLRLNSMRNIRAYTDYDKRNGTHLEVDGAPAVTLCIESLDGGKRYTYRDRRYILDGITYAEEFYQPDYSNVKPAEPTDYRRTLYWNPYATPDADGVFRATFYNNSSKATRVDISACGLDKNGKITINH